LPAEIAEPFDSVSVCLSKGLGAPVGSVLCAPRDLIAKARRWRKVLGGGMRQAGILAAAGIYALEHNVGRLAQDHENARALAEQLSRCDEVEVAPGGAQTNMLFVSVDPKRSMKMREYLKERGMLVRGNGTIRLVTHLDADAARVLGGPHVDRPAVGRGVGGVEQEVEHHLPELAGVGLDPDRPLGAEPDAAVVVRPRQARRSVGADGVAKRNSERLDRRHARANLKADRHLM